MPNRLAHTTSPYLLQHAHNPVDWYAWGPEALQQARQSGKPILLSIGYSACHWCHVMAHESFENEAIAKLMNEHFINIKVDREERPDLDKIYQLAQQVLTQHAGGWPLTMFLSHDNHTPFFGGTYFPPEPRRGMPGFAELLPRIASYYREHQQDIEQQRAALLDVFAQLQAQPALTQPLDDTPLRNARHNLQARFDGEFGGFSRAPKFPLPRTIEFLLRRWHASSGDEQPDLHALFMAALTLTRMADGGVYDQLAGGFFRYSVDDYWLIPHFEKMLYDNAELLRVYAQAALATGDPLFKRITHDTAYWLLSDLRNAEQCFHSALDADSEGHEGRYYVWTREQISSALTNTEFEIVKLRFGLDQPANFEGQWHLHVYRSVDDVAKQLQREPASIEHDLHHALRKMLTVRQTRVSPGLDTKALTSWNALAICGLAQAARALDDERLIDAACAALDQLRKGAWRAGRLFAVQSQGQSQFPAYLDDHAFLLAACLEMMQTRWRSEDVLLASELAEQLLSRFADAERGGFYFTAHDHESLIHRSRSFADEATPAGNGVAALSLLQLGHLLGEPRYLEAAEACVRADWQALLDHPDAHCSLLMALEELLAPAQQIVIRGDAEATAWQRELNKLYQPRRMVFAIPPDASLPEHLAMKKSARDTLAYVCQGVTCSEPVSSLAALIALAR